MKTSIVILEKSILDSEMYLRQVWSRQRCSADGPAMSALSANPATDSNMAHLVIAGTGNQCLATGPEFSRRRRRALTRVLSLCELFLIEILRWQPIRQDTCLLMPMDDRILADIGLRRDQVEGAHRYSLFDAHD